MIEGGYLIILASVAMMFVHAAPATAHALRRPVRMLGCGIVLRTAFPLIAAPAPRLSTLVEQADAALDRDALMRGVRGVTATYDQA
jgi:hypothetical protein